LLAPEQVIAPGYVPIAMFPDNDDTHVGGVSNATSGATVYVNAGKAPPYVMS
jgi:hypothetical protein